MSLSSRLTVVALLAAAVVTTTAGCESANSATQQAARPTHARSTSTSAPPATTAEPVSDNGMPPGVWKSAVQATQEYQQAEQALTLAPGWRWRPIPEPATGPDGRPQFYQLGAATNDAQLYWF